MPVTAHNSIYEIKPYIGGNVTPPDLKKRVNLACNENAYGSSPTVIKAITENLQVYSYPNGGANSLRQVIAQHFKLDPCQVICGNGSEDILHLISRCFAKQGEEVIVPQYGFQVYQIAALSVGAKVVYAPQPHYYLDPPLLIQAITDKTKIIYIDNSSHYLF